MSINIAIIDKNEIFRESLKMLLEQIPGFHVTICSGMNKCADSLTGEPPEVLLLDDCIGQNRCRSIIDEILLQNKSLKIIVLTIDPMSLYLGYPGTKVMLKYSEKKEFEFEIRSLLDPDSLTNKR
jgi:DNA-binding NarL/FixJ family response regulator